MIYTYNSVFKLKMNNNLSTKAYVGLFLTTLLVLTLSTSSTYFAFRDEDADCQKGTIGGITLSDWLKGFGLEKTILTLLIWVSLGLNAVSKNKNGFLPLEIGLVLDIFFHIIWWCWGVVILATEENDLCVIEGEDMAMVAIVNLMIAEISFIYHIIIFD